MKGVKKMKTMMLKTPTEIKTRRKKMKTVSDVEDADGYQDENYPGNSVETSLTVG
ncbi:hypothetical protein LR48_Vigan09g220300 [Vigna angularis]|uniref:Uncharacterized protein n=1 Tax=Phaseolus angularis TaxID=3914 RepID=A0A0L9VFV0_PHAAN|nr:hypothetical protein LR48_Vigan09g220300 [Vigna angularis]